MKVICAGLGKTGTKSMREALEILGYENVHDVAEQFVYDKDILWKALIENSATEKDLKEAFENVDAIMDIPGAVLWKELMDAFPEAKIVLTVRHSPETWTKSFGKSVDIESQFAMLKYYHIMQALCFNKICRKLCPLFYSTACIREQGFHRALNCPADFKQVCVATAKQRYVDHNASVIAECPKNRLLVFNVSEGWEPLCRFLDKDIPDIPFPRLNVGHTLIEDIANNKYKYDAGLNKLIMREILLVIAFYTICLFILLCLFYTFRYT